VSEWFLKGTPAQLGYTDIVPFMLIVGEENT